MVCLCPPARGGGRAVREEEGRKEGLENHGDEYHDGF